MKPIYLFLFSSLPMTLLSLAALIKFWNTEERWRFGLALAAFAIFFLLALAHAYVVFFRKRKF